MTVRETAPADNQPTDAIQSSAADQNAKDRIFFTMPGQRNQTTQQDRRTRCVTTNSLMQLFQTQLTLTLNL